MLKKILIYIILLFTITPSLVNADDGVSSMAKNWFNSYSKKISFKNNTEKQIIFFKWFSDKLVSIENNSKFNDWQKKLIGDLIKLSNEYIFNLEFNESEKLAKSKLNSNELLKDFKHFLYNKDQIFIENWVWYTYKYDKHLKFPEWSVIKKEDLAFNSIKPENAIVFLKDDNNSLWFIVNYTKVKLISDDIIYWIPNKFWFLREIKDDKKTLNNETDDLFKKLKAETITLTKWKTKEAKIKEIYNYILNNLVYPENFSLDDYKLFSWIDSYKNKQWICEWYTKEAMYILNFANIWDTQVIRWFVLDAPDFPKVWHAWLKIWDKYFDPTFDDPIWNQKTLSFNEYKYYSLPKDLLYTNRYDFEKIPEEIKQTNIETRKKLISKNIEPLISKYKNSWYLLLKPYLLKINNWISIDKKLDIADLTKILKYAEVVDFKFTLDWKTKSIAWYNYFLITDDNAEELMEQTRYDTTNYYLLKWKLDNLKYEYRLVYDLKTN